jgi:hypothetical protein
VRKLGFRYLWIDALCIIQDSEEDWRKEAAVMDRVYGRAALTISCADSANNWSGIFVQRKRQRSIPLHLPEYPDLQLQDLHVSVLEDSKDVYSDLEESVINGRAWTLQERLMSRANLHFTNEALIWECRTHTRTEDGHNSSSHPFFKNIANYHPPAADDAISLWYIIVEDYTRRKLTYDSDKLAAVAGLARYLSSIVAGASGYSFGLWKSDLPRGLLWGRRAESLEDIPHSATTSRAPSWSWASRKGEISYSLGVVTSPPLKSEFDLQIHDTSTTGALSSHLQVEGYLQETYYDPRAKYDASKSTIGFDCNIGFWMDGRVFEGRCWCLYVGAWMFSDTLRLEFLVLEELLGGYGRLFNRIGLASFTVKDYSVVDFGEKMNTIMRSPRRRRLTLCSPEGIRI